MSTSNLGPDMFQMMAPALVADPYPIYAMLNASNPVMHATELFGLGGYIVTSHAVCAQVLRSKSFGKEGDKVLSAEQLSRIPQERSELSARRRNNMLFRDPPDHTRLRGLVNQAFTPRTTLRLRPHIASLVEQLIDDMERKGSADLLADFAFPLPVIVIAELLGVPAADRARFKAWSTDITPGLNPGATPEILSKAVAAISELDVYLNDVIRERRAAPRQDLISELIRAQNEGDRLSDAEMSATCRLLLTAGHETTVNLIGNGMLALLRAPAERDKLAADPSLLPGAIEELLRYDSPVQLTMRFTFEEFSLGAHTARPGDVVALILGAANRDPQQFADPGRLDICRDNAHTHLSFALGNHYCLGAALARLEGAMAIEGLLRRLPRLALSSEPLSFRNNLVLRGLTALPVTF